MKKAIFLLIGMFLLAACGRTTRFSSSAPPAGLQRSFSPKTLLNTSGSGEDISNTFRLTEPCGKFVISWTAKQTQDGQPFMNFRVYDTSITDYAVKSYGTISFSGEDSGRSGFPLDAGSYYLQIQGHKASWTVKVTCEG
jgi:hypothetical protein